MDPQRVNFLLVEDDDDHARLVVRHIERTRFGNVLHRVKDGEAALAYLRREREYAYMPRPDVVLLDLNLPKFSGHEVLEELKKDEELRRIPVVVLTTSAAEADRLRAYDLHVNSYLVKPMNYDEFSRMIEELGRYWGGWNRRSE